MTIDRPGLAWPWEELWEEVVWTSVLFGAQPDVPRRDLIFLLIRVCFGALWLCWDFFVKFPTWKEKTFFTCTSHSALQGRWTIGVQFPCLSNFYGLGFFILVRNHLRPCVTHLEQVPRLWVEVAKDSECSEETQRDEVFVSWRLCPDLWAYSTKERIPSLSAVHVDSLRFAESFHLDLKYCECEARGSWNWPCGRPFLVGASWKTWSVFRSICSLHQSHMVVVKTFWGWL